MTEHLTRHSAEHNDDVAATREGDVREQGDRTGFADSDHTDSGLADGGHADFREQGAHSGTDGGHADSGHMDFREPAPAGGDHSLSTADLASASARPEPGRDGADTGTAGTSTSDARPSDTAGTEAAPPLIDEEKVTGFRDRWQGVQTGFVDDPQRAVREADELVAAVISALATTFAEHKSELEGQWQHGEPATEDLRVALRRYRSFFDQLLPS